MNRIRLLEVVLTLGLVLMLLFLAGRWVYQIRLYYALSGAASEGDVDEVRSLLAKGPNVNSQRMGMTALMSAAAEHHTEVVKLLLQARADVNLRSDDGATALMLAAALAQVRPRAAKATMHALLEHGADANIVMKNGKSPMTWARQIDTLLRTNPASIRRMHQQMTQPAMSILRSEKYSSPEEYAASLRAVCDELLPRGGT